MVDGGRTLSEIVFALWLGILECRLLDNDFLAINFRIREEYDTYGDPVKEERGSKYGVAHQSGGYYRNRIIHM